MAHGSVVQLTSGGGRGSSYWPSARGGGVQPLRAEQVRRGGYMSRRNEWSGSRVSEENWIGRWLGNAVGAKKWTQTLALGPSMRGSGPRWENISIVWDGEQHAVLLGVRERKGSHTYYGHHGLVSFSGMGIGKDLGAFPCLGSCRATQSPDPAAPHTPV